MKENVFYLFKKRCERDPIMKAILEYLSSPDRPKKQCDKCQGWFSYEKMNMRNCEGYSEKYQKESQADALSA